MKQTTLQGHFIRSSRLQYVGTNENTPSTCVFVLERARLRRGVRAATLPRAKRPTLEMWDSGFRFQQRRAPTSCTLTYAIDSVRL